MDTVANMLTTLINAQRVNKVRVAVPYAKMQESLLKFLKEKKRIASMRVQEGEKPKLVVTLKYDEDKNPAIRGVRRVSKPGARKYVSAAAMPYTKHGDAFFVVSTSKGIIDEVTARRTGIGGELICEIW